LPRERPHASVGLGIENRDYALIGYRNCVVRHGRPRSRTGRRFHAVPDQDAGVDRRAVIITVADSETEGESVSHIHAQTFAEPIYQAAGEHNAGAGHDRFAVGLAARHGDHHFDAVADCDPAADSQPFPNPKRQRSPREHAKGARHSGNHASSHDIPDGAAAVDFDGATAIFRACSLAGSR
jgi:hypothetical protein